MIGSELQGRYRITRRLGGGSMGEVFLAEHLVLHRPEAIKVLRASSAQTPEHAARFRREARALNRVTHPNIVAVHDFGQLEDGRFYLAMEYAEGKSLDRLLKERRKLPLIRALHILAKIADAIEHAHSHGVIHRDLKPSNVVLTRGVDSVEEPKVLDFGLAKIVSPGYDDSVGGTDGTALGTPYYMAPELIANRDWDDRIDIYSLGCMAFELLTGKPPFGGSLMDVCQAHVSEPPPRLRDRPAGKLIPIEIEELIYACLQKNPDERVQSAWEVALSLREAAAGIGPAETKRPTSIEEVETQKTPQIITKRRNRRSRYLEGTTSKRKASPQMDFAQALAELARAILDQGCDDVRLVVAYSALAEAESAVRRYQAELEGVRWRRVVIEQYFREREATLRFAVGELRFAASRREYVGQGLAQIAEATGALEKRLAGIRQRGEKELAWIVDAEAGVTSSLERAQDHLREQRYAVYDVVAALVPYYQSVGIVGHLWAQLGRSGRSAAESA